MQPTEIPLAILGQLLFTMMGPIALIPTYAGATVGMTNQQQRRVSFLAFGFSCLALILSVFIGAAIMASWGVSPSALMVAAGAVLILASLQGLLGWGTKSPKSLPRAELQLAVSPIAFPTMIRPYGIGVLIIFVSYFPSLENKLSIISISIAIMVLNLGAMFVSHRVMAAIGTVSLTILGSVFSILQVALGVEILASGLSRMSG